MKRLIIAVMYMLLGTELFAKQHVLLGEGKLLNTSTVSAAANICYELIERGYHIDSVAIGRHSYVIVYSDKDEECLMNSLKEEAKNK